MRHAALLLFAVCFALAPAVSQAQDAPATTSAPRWAIGPYFGFSPHSPVGKYWGLTPDRRHFFFGVRATATLIERGRWSFSYAPEVVPLLVVTNNPTYLSTPTSDDTALVVVENGRGPVTGFAIAPIGLETNIQLRPRLKTYAAGALGSVWFTRQVPQLDTRLFNFTFEFGGGLRWQVSARDWLRFGYKFHHLSNAKTARLNPGIDAQVFFLGFERSLGGRRASARN